MIGYRKALLGSFAIVCVQGPAWWIMLRTVREICDNAKEIIVQSMVATGIIVGAVCAGYGAEYISRKWENRSEV